MPLGVRRTRTGMGKLDTDVEEKMEEPAFDGNVTLTHWKGRGKRRLSKDVTITGTRSEGVVDMEATV